MKQLTSNKQFWRWLSLVAYIAILAWMGFEKLHRSHPAVFFVSIAILTIVLMLVFKFLYRGESEV